MQILKATPADIEYWHAAGGYCPLQSLLIRWGLSQFTPHSGYNKIKIGYDFKNKCMTVAIDATQYVTIQFEKGRPQNMAYADELLNYFKNLAQDTAGR